jgi:prepilin-type N-terminal cleavage/methylation domain-containing protein
MHAPRQTSQSGFSLVEMIIVLSIIGIISAGVVPVYVSSMAGMRMRNAQNDFVALINFVQERAVTDGREYRLFLDPKEGTYWVEWHSGYDRDEKTFSIVEEPWGELHYLPERLEMERPKARKDRGSSAFYIACFPNGASDIATLRLRDRLNWRSRLTIKTEGAMGKISVESR